MENVYLTEWRWRTGLRDNHLTSKFNPEIEEKLYSKQYIRTIIFYNELTITKHLK